MILCIECDIPITSDNLGDFTGLCVDCQCYLGVTEEDNYELRR